MEIIVLLGSLNGETARWIGPDERLVEGDWNAFAAAARGQRVVWLLPGEECSLMRVHTPARARKDLAQAVPFAVEEELPSDLEDNALAFARLGDAVGVLVAEAEPLRARYRQLVGLGVRPRLISSELLAVPWESGSWSLLGDAQRVLVRVDEGLGWVCETSQLGWMLQQHLAQLEPEQQPQQVIVWGGVSLDGLPELSYQQRPESPAASLRSGLKQAPPLDLSEPLRAGDSLSTKDRWRFAAGMALAALALSAYLGAVAWENQRLELYNQRLSQKMEALYRQSFPQARRVVKPRLQMAQGLARLQSGDTDSDGFLVQLADTLEALLEQGERLQLVGLSFQPDSLAVQVRLADLQGLDQLRQRLETGAQRTVRIQAVDRQADAVSATLRISGANG